MKGRGVRLRFVLPIVFGFLAAILMVWDYENNRMIELMGMGWDTGPPVWPYQVVFFFLWVVNFPAFLLCLPILWLLRLDTLSLQYGVWFPVFVWFWWWIGTRIDFGLLGRRRIRYPKIVAGGLAVASIVFGYWAVHESVAGVRWWLEYRDYSTNVGLVVLRIAGTVSWCLVLAGGCALAVRRLLEQKTEPPSVGRSRCALIPIVLACAAMYLFGVHCWDRFLNPAFNYDECAVDRLYALGCVHGTVVDESGKAIGHMEVSLIPMFKMGEARRYGTRSEWTDDQGRYNLNGLEPGEYRLGANAFSVSHGPDTERPFATSYYPGAASEAEAGAIKVVRSTALRLSPLRLAKLDVTTIKISVLWADGTRPERSNILFSNILYPNSGGTMPQIDDGVGEFTLVKGFEYDASASVECDGGKIIESRWSKPEQRVRVADGVTPAEMTFVIPGSPCKLWNPR